MSVSPLKEVRAEEITFERIPATAPGPGAQPAIAALCQSGSAAGEELRMLRAKLRSLAATRPLRRIGVVSASAGEGKSLVAFGLARTLAREAGHRVLLVESDLRRFNLERAMGLAPTAGLGEWLEGSGSVVRTRRLSLGFDLLPAGKSERPELLGGPRMAALLDAALARFDSIVLDCPPLLPVADSVILQDLVDGFLFVVRFRHSPRETIAKAVTHLERGRILGFVYNGHREIIPGAHSYAYRRYGRPY